MNRNIFRRIVAGSILVAALSPVVARESLDIETFLDMVESNSLQLESARTDRALAETQERLARSQVYPFIGGQVGLARNLYDIEQPVAAYADGNATSAAGGIYPVEYADADVNSDYDFTVGLSVQQNLFDMAVFRALEASAEYIELTGTVYEATRQGLLTEAKRLFYLTLLLQEVLSVVESSEEIARDNYLETQRRQASGLASPLDVLRAEVNWKITQPETSQARRNLNVAMQNLRTMAGISPDDDVVLLGSLESVPALPDVTNVEGARMNRPDYQALLNQRRLLELNVSAEMAKFYPSLSASLTYGLQASDDNFDFSDPVDSLSVGLTMTVPIFYGGSRFALVEQARLELTQTQTDIAMMDDTIRTELETIRLTLEEANLRVSSAEQTLATAERAYGVSETALDNGLATQLELKDARISLQQARLNYLSATFDYLSSYFDWQLAVGRGAEPLPVTGE